MEMEESFINAIKIFRKKIKKWRTFGKCAIKTHQRVNGFCNGQQGYICMDTSQSKTALDMHYAARHRIFNLMHQGRKGFRLCDSHVRQNLAVQINAQNL